MTVINKLTVPDVRNEHGQATHPVPFRHRRHIVLSLRMGHPLFSIPNALTPKENLFPRLLTGWQYCGVLRALTDARDRNQTGRAAFNTRAHLLPTTLDRAAYG